MKLLRKLFNILSVFVYIIIAAYLLIAAPMLAGYKPVVVLSGSMEPTYHVGSVIYYKSTPFENINNGDPITFRVGEDTLVTHRVVEKNEADQTFTTKGDANNTEDGGAVAYTNVAGKAGKISIPYAGYFINYGKNPIAIGGMAGIIILSVLFDSLFPDKKREGERAEKNEENKEKQD